MISDEAIDAASSALYSDEILSRNTIRAMLEAAGSHMFADVWDEGNRIGYQDRGREAQGAKLRTNPYRSQDDK